MAVRGAGESDSLGKTYPLHRLKDENLVDLIGGVSQSLKIGWCARASSDNDLFEQAGGKGRLPLALQRHEREPFQRSISANRVTAKRWFHPDKPAWVAPASNSSANAGTRLLPHLVQQHAKHKENSCRCSILPLTTTPSVDFCALDSSISLSCLPSFPPPHCTVCTTFVWRRPPPCIPLPTNSQLQSRCQPANTFLAPLHQQQLLCVQT